MRRIMVEIEPGEPRAFIARTYDEGVARAAGTTHLYAMGKTREEALSRLLTFASDIMQEPLDGSEA